MFRGLDLVPGDVVTAIIEASPFAAPELPALIGNQTLSVVVPPICRADLDFNQRVDFGDLLQLAERLG